MQEEEKPPDELPSTTTDTPITEEPEAENIFPLKNVFDNALKRAKEIREKYSEEQNTDIQE